MVEADPCSTFAAWIVRVDLNKESVDDEHRGPHYPYTPPKNARKNTAMVANIDLSEFSEEERRDIQAELDEGFAEIEQK